MTTTPSAAGGGGHTSARYDVRSLSPAFWYVYDATLPGRGQVGRPYASRTEALKAFARATGASQ